MPHAAMSASVLTSNRATSLLLTWTLALLLHLQTADITRPFPSSRPVGNPSWEFVWNNWLGASLRAEGLAHTCPPLLQVGTCFREGGSAPAK